MVNFDGNALDFLIGLLYMSRYGFCKAKVILSSPLYKETIDHSGSWQTFISPLEYSLPPLPRE